MSLYDRVRDGNGCFPHDWSPTNSVIIGSRTEDCIMKISSCNQQFLPLYNRLCNQRLLHSFHFRYTRNGGHAKPTLSQPAHHTFVCWHRCVRSVYYFFCTLSLLWCSGLRPCAPTSPYFVSCPARLVIQRADPTLTSAQLLGKALVLLVSVGWICCHTYTSDLSTL